MKPHESPRIRKNQFVAIRTIRGLCGIGVLSDEELIAKYIYTLHVAAKKNEKAGSVTNKYYSQTCLQEPLKRRQICFQDW